MMKKVYVYAQGRRVKNGQKWRTEYELFAWGYLRERSKDINQSLHKDMKEMNEKIQLVSVCEK